MSSAAESEVVASQVTDTGGVYFVPAFSGLLAPHWRDDARGVIVGLSGTCILLIVSLDVQGLVLVVIVNVICNPPLVVL